MFELIVEETKNRRKREGKRNKKIRFLIFELIVEEGKQKTWRKREV